MPAKVCSAGCLSKAVPSKIEPIWITDAVLADAFQRYTHASRRYGSNVPGPLEARRRANKRRNTSLAYTGAPAPPMDPALLFPTQTTQPWWQKTSDSVSWLTQKPLPAWLLASTPQAKRAGDRSMRPTSVVEAPVGFLSLRESFREARTVKEIHGIMKTHQIDLRRNPITNSLFPLLLQADSGWSAIELATYIADPELNPPGTNNHEHIWHKLFGNELSETQNPLNWPHQWHTLHQGLCKAVSLGLVNVRALEIILDELHQIKLRYPFGRVETQAEDVSQRQVLELIRSLCSSNVLGMKDVQASVLQSLAKRLQGGHLSSSTVELLGILWRTQPPRDTVLARTFTSWLTRIQDCSDESMRIQLVDAILTLSQASRANSCAKLFMSVAERLFRQPQDLPGRLASLTIWQEIVEQVCARQTTTMRGYWSEVLSAHQKQSHLRPGERAVLFLWLFGHLMSRSHDAYQERALSDYQLGQRLGNALRTTEPLRALDSLADIVRTIDRLPVPVPHSSVLMTTRLFKTYVLPPRMEKLSSYLNTEDSVEKICLLLANDLFYEGAKAFYRHELTRICERATVELREFANVMRKLLKGDVRNLRIVNRVLSNNRMFKLGLAQAKRSRQEWRAVVVTENAILVRSKPLGNESSVPGIAQPAHEIRDAIPDKTAFLPIPPPATLLNVIDQIALAIATDEDIPHQRAYNRVRWCWRFLRQNKMSVSQVISRALWHTGVTRAGSAGCSESQFRWLIKTVMVVEGRQVADLLKQSSQFRNHRRSTLETVAQDIADEDEDENELTKNESDTFMTSDDLATDDSDEFMLPDELAIHEYDEPIHLEESDPYKMFRDPYNSAAQSNVLPNALDEPQPAQPQTEPSIDIFSAKESIEPSEQKKRSKLSSKQELGHQKRAAQLTTCPVGVKLPAAGAYADVFASPEEEPGQRGARRRECKDILAASQKTEVRLVKAARGGVFG